MKKNRDADDGSTEFPLPRERRTEVTLPLRRPASPSPIRTAMAPAPAEEDESIDERRALEKRGKVMAKVVRLSSVDPGDTRLAVLSRAGASEEDCIKAIASTTLIADCNTML